MNTENSILQIPVEDIIPNRFQPRLNFDDQGLQELSKSIKEHGIIQPLVVRKNGEKYEIIAGERRYRAAMMAGLLQVPAILSNINDQASAEIALTENVQRRELTCIEEAKSYQNILDSHTEDINQLANKMGVSVNTIQNKLKLLTLADEVQEALLKEQISERHARSLLNLNDKTKQVEWLNKIINERMTVRQLDLALKKEHEVDNDNDVKLIPDITKLFEENKYIMKSNDINIESNEVNNNEPAPMANNGEVITLGNEQPVEEPKIEENVIEKENEPEPVTVEETSKPIEPTLVNEQESVLEEPAIDNTSVIGVVEEQPNNNEIEEIESLDDFILNSEPIIQTPIEDNKSNRFDEFNEELTNLINKYQADMKINKVVDNNTITINVDN
ncbi:MAG: ParB/RepB/Spo0J family partition protein [Bacilli bacterium]|nr:ParB/RepB/Spo0J family partition protein [Bacilli bacterium]